ncbi:MAG: hypothetical protein J7551_07360 [Chloroflexi bacterium]|nr:hypothetical protein [Chloroflexota bacterium]
MPVRIEWYDPETPIVLSTFVGDITRAEAEEAIATYIGFLDNAERQVHFISDVRSIGKTSGFALSELKALADLLQHPRFGYVVVVGSKPTVHFALKVLAKLFNLRYTPFGDVEEGARFLREVARIHSL